MEMQPLASRQEERITEDAPTDRLITWTLERFENQRMIMTTSFGMEGCALIDMYARHGRPVTVVYLDTMFFFPETYALRDRISEWYPHLDFVNRGTTLTPEQQAAEYGAELWKHDSDKCCHLRKVDPMYDVMANVDVWITGLRRSQSATRANLRIVDWDWRYQVLKISPLAAWERPQIWEYIQKNNVPYNELHEKGYPTLGCTHCTKPVPGSTPGDYSRDGRWSGTGKLECGLHDGAGI
ncbi:MAG: phosphoadenylyl-sulfate reductase [Phycisphaerales bacterium]|nr:MAG: phosphoadenylyl-sulfate reductase [Phycisphaerales bacterium]